MPTPAQHHADALLKAHPLMHPSLDNVRRVALEFGYPPPAAPPDPVDRTQYLLRGLTPGLPTVLQDMLAAGQIAVREVGIASAGAYMKQLGPDAFVVVMQSGMFEFLYRIARPLSANVFKTKNDPDAVLEMPNFARVLAEIVWWSYQTEIAFGPEYPVTQDQKVLANYVACYAETFLLAHELGHVYIALIRAQSTDLDGMGARNEEHGADVAAFRFLLSALPPEHAQDPWHLALAYCGIELALQIWGLMERIGIDFMDVEHPPTSLRLELLRSELRSLLPSEEAFEGVLAVAKTLEAAFDEVSNIIRQPAEHGATFAREADACLASINALLDQCSAGVVPDYIGFSAGATHLLARGYPEFLYTHVFVHVAQEFGALVRKQNTGDADAARLLYNRYKLLFSLAKDMPEPAKSFFGSALAQARQGG